MKTKIQNLFIALAWVALPTLVQAQFTFTINNGAVTITGYNTAAGLDVVIPNMIYDYPVTSIGYQAFYGSGITNVTIPDSVTSIGQFAFQNCISLTSVTIGNGVTSIADRAFQYDYGITSVTIPDSVTSIGPFAFDYCISLTSVTIGNSVTSIGDRAFLDCASLTNITVDASNPAYSSRNGVLFDKAQATLLQFPDSLGGSYTIPGSVTSIGFEAFAGCANLTSVTIPNSVTYIGVTAFGRCTSLTSVTIGTSVTSIGGGVFQLCTNLTGIYFQGNSPSPTNDSTVFSSDPATVYYLPGTTGWGAMFDGLPTAPWFLPNPLILVNGPGFGVQPGGFGFTISWATNVSVVVEAATNLANPVWIPMSTSPLTSGTNYFSDPQWTNYPERFYRITTTPTFPGITGNLDVDMYNAAVADGTANGGVPAVMGTENGGPFRVTAAGRHSNAVCRAYFASCVFTHVVGTYSCSSTTLPSGADVIQFGTVLECGFGPYGY